VIKYLRIIAAIGLLTSPSVTFADQRISIGESPEIRVSTDSLGHCDSRLLLKNIEQANNLISFGFEIELQSVAPNSELNCSCNGPGRNVILYKRLRDKSVKERVVSGKYAGFSIPGELSISIPRDDFVSGPFEYFQFTFNCL
jgi:hypothetical protein